MSLARALPSAALLLAACGPTGHSVRTGAALPAKPADCALVVALDRPLDRPYEVVGMVEAEGTGSVSELIPVLMREGCALGADALIQLEKSVGSGYSAIAQGQGGMAQGVGSSYSTYHATATAVRFVADAPRP